MISNDLEVLQFIVSVLSCSCLNCHSWHEWWQDNTVTVGWSPVFRSRQQLRLCSLQ